MKNNDATPKLDVDPQTYEVFVDGEKITSEPATELPLAKDTSYSRRYSDDSRRHSRQYR